jgi:hypothetical protein
MADSIAQQLHLTALMLKEHGSQLGKRRIDERVRRGARRLSAGAALAYEEEGRALLRSAATDIDGNGEPYDELAIRIRRIADYLEVKDDRQARFHVSRVHALVMDLPRRERTSA